MVYAASSMAGKRGAAARRALLALRAHARRSLLVDALARRTRRRHAAQGLRALALLGDGLLDRLGLDKPAPPQRTRERERERWRARERERGRA